jgi:hypothetical protein
MEGYEVNNKNSKMISVDRKVKLKINFRKNATI